MTPEPHPDPIGRVRLGPGVAAPPDAVRFTFTRSAGPGGQNVNKRATRAQLRLDLASVEGLTDAARARLERLASTWLTDDGEIVVSSDEHRSQRRNRAACLERLREIVARAVVEPKRRRPTRVPRWSVRRRLDEKRRRGEIKRRRSGDEP